MHVSTNIVVLTLTLLNFINGLVHLPFLEMHIWRDQDKNLKLDSQQCRAWMCRPALIYIGDIGFSFLSPATKVFEIGIPIFKSLNKDSEARIFLHVQACLNWSFKEFKKKFPPENFIFPMQHFLAFIFISSSLPNFQKKILLNK